MNRNITTLSTLKMNCQLPATSCQGWAQCQAPGEQDWMLSVPRQQSSSSDYGPKPDGRLLSAGSLHGATPVILQYLNKTHLTGLRPVSQIFVKFELTVVKSI